MATKSLSESTEFQALMTAKANDSVVVKKTGNETIEGTKTFSSPVVIPEPVSANHAASRGFVLGQVPNLAGYQLLSGKGAASGYAPLNSSSKVPPEYLPPLSYDAVVAVANQAARLALSAVVGAAAYQIDNETTYILAALPASTNGNWVATTAFSLDWAAITNKPNLMTGINVKDYGATGDGVTDDTDAIQAAIDASIASGGHVVFPYATYNYTHLDISGYGNGGLTWRGEQGYNWWGDNGNAIINSKTRLRCIATDGLDGITAFQQIGLRIEDLQFEYVDGFTGILFNLGGEGGSGSNTNLFSRCRFLSKIDLSYKTAKAFVGLENTVCTYFIDCTFSGAGNHILGREVDTAFSNDQRFYRCTFADCIVSIKNALLNWLFDGCTWEFRDTDTISAFGWDVETLPGYATNLIVVNSTFWDVSGAQIPFKLPVDTKIDITISNNWFHLMDGKLCEILGDGSFTFRDNRYFGTVPVNSSCIIDLGSTVRNAEDVLCIEGNKWGVAEGDRSNTIIGFENFTNKSIRNNSDNNGAWATEGASTWVIDPVDVVLNDDNNGKRFLGGTVEIGDDSDVSPGASWECYSLPFSSQICVITLPATHRTYIGGIDSMITDTTSATLTVNSGMVKITNLLDGGYWHILVSGEYTLA